MSTIPIKNHDHDHEEQTKVSRLEHQINSILLHEQFHFFRNECLLSCCTLLLQETNKSIFHKVIEKRASIIDFSFRLIQYKIKTDPLLSRLGIRVLSRCLGDYDTGATSLSFTHIQKLDWEKILQLLVHHLNAFVEKEKIENDFIFLTIELIELCTMVVQVTSDTKQYECLSTFPSLLVGACIHIQNPIIDGISTTKERMDNSDESMAIVLERILGTEIISDGSDVIASFVSAAAEFMVVHVHTLLPKSSSPTAPWRITSGENPVYHDTGIISQEFLRQISNLLYHAIRSDDGSIISMTTDIHLMLRYALISYMYLDLRICEELIAKKEPEISLLIQKIVFSGLTSDGDATFKTYLNVNISNMIRTMSLFITAEWMENLGYFWLISDTVKSDNDTTLGSYSAFCTMARLVAGELRIALGTLFDYILDLKDPDQKEFPVKNRKDEASKIDYDQYLQRGMDCIRIQLSVLHVMVEIANDDDCNSHIKQPMTADVILHIRHSLQDTFDSCIQFLSEEACDILSTWRPIYLYCIRFTGAYLSEVNVFYHGDADEEELSSKNTNDTHQGIDRQERRHGRDSPTSTHTSVSVTSILRAIKNGLSFLSVTNEKSNMKHSTTLFPCIVATIASCENPKQAQVLCKGLLSDSTIIDAIRSILNFEIQSSFELGPIFMNNDESKGRVSWCCVILDTILNFDSTYKPRTFPSCLTISGRKRILKQLFKLSTMLGNVVCEQDDVQTINDFVPLLIDVVQCWISVLDSLNSSSSSSHDFTEEEMQIMNLHTWLNFRGHLD